MDNPLLEEVCAQRWTSAPKDGEMTSERRALQWEGPLTGSLHAGFFAKYQMYGQNEMAFF